METSSSWVRSWKLRATINYIKIQKDYLDPFLNNAFIVMENVHLYTVSKPPIFVICLLMSLRLEGEETLKYRCVCRLPHGKV